MTCVLLLAALVATPAGSLPRAEDCPKGLSGITHVSSNLYYAISDSDSLLVPLTIDIDPNSGRPKSCIAGTPTELEASGKRADLEGLAWDSANGWIWAADEFNASIRAFDPSNGARRAYVFMPAVQDAFRYNRSLESLAISKDGKEMWFCNEEALCAVDARRERDGVRAPRPRPETDADDGPRATRENGTAVRLMRFVRDSPDREWRQSGEWAYKTDPIGGMDFVRKSRCGVSDLAVLDDGTLLVLERELSVKLDTYVPSFRCCIYKVDVEDATDVSKTAGLKDFEGAFARKTLVWKGNTGFANYEGICEGPRLNDGSRTLVLISDADAGAAACVMSLKLKAEGEK